MEQHEPEEGLRVLLEGFAHYFNCIAISIHALREEGDYEAGLQQGDRQISIHALREEGDAFDVEP